MSVMTMVQAINNALDIKLAEDKSIVMYGEDVGVEGGVFRVTEGLQKKIWCRKSFRFTACRVGHCRNRIGNGHVGSASRGRTSI